ncbi:unnamed protein product [Hermetia illucens]|uniref:Phosducin domain-containing protein n=1 Tax=Hermetia illucens TaxID=343691 RepID=A0A7R8UHG3_HERIL|nr:phosducin-like protein [Hermetia illucens]CAD7080927.1 unnamed protein product [Hermetia illucens]
MATLEDKILGEKLEYYCSSSEGEDNADSDSEESAGKSSQVKQVSAAPTIDPSKVTQWNGNAQNTGPKGVVQDWQLFKQLEAQQREENERQRIELAKKCSMTANSAREDEERKKNEELEKELAELLDDEVLQQFQKQRIQEMMKIYGQQQKQFGKVLNLTSGDQFLNEVEKEAAQVTVIIHIYENNIPGCKTLNSCLDTLAAEHKHIKFCKICSTAAGTSLAFKTKGLPAILVYRGNQVIGNFVRLTDELSDEFYPSDLEGFLIENGMIDDKSIIPLVK